jgi:hypothetical protein
VVVGQSVVGPSDLGPQPGACPRAGYRPSIARLGYWWHKTTGSWPDDERDEPRAGPGTWPVALAAASWERLGCAYQRALALSESEQWIRWSRCSRSAG